MNRIIRSLKRQIQKDNVTAKKDDQALDGPVKFKAKSINIKKIV